MEQGSKKANKKAFGAGRGVRLLALFVCACALFFYGCGTYSAPYEKQLFAMDTYMELRVYGEKSAAEAALSEAASAVRRFDALLSPTLSDSDVYRLNNSGGAAAAVAPETFDIIEKTLAFSKEAGGAFDCTLYPVSRAWGFVSEGIAEYRVPDRDELAALLEYVDDGAIALDPASLSVRLPEGAELELGAAAKGYAGDAARRALKDMGVTSALFDMGSSTIVTIGEKPDGGKWRIAVRDPKNGQAYAGAVTLGEGAVSTSGGYERCFTAEDGTVYWHILDPETGMPARNGVISVTVLTDEAFYGDVLSTALFVMGLDSASEYWRQKGDFEFIMIAEDGELFLTEGAAEAFTPLGAYKNVSVTVITHED